MKKLLLILLLPSLAYGFTPDQKGEDTVKPLKTRLIKAAKVYGIDELVLEGIVYAEAARGNITKEAFERHVMQMGIVPQGFIFKHPFGFSPGQVHPRTVFPLENYCAAIGNRKPRTKKRIVELLLDDQIALLYSACVLRYTKEVYASYGFEIEPDVWATAYNIGHAEERAKRDALEKRTPAPNEFGIYVKDYVDAKRK